MRRRGVTPHLAQNTKGRRSAIDRRTTRHRVYAVNLRVRKRIEEVFSWIKTVGGLRKTRHRGTARVGWMFTLTAAAITSRGCPGYWAPRRSSARGLPAARFFASSTDETSKIAAPWPA